MLEYIRNWVITIIISVLIAALFETLSPEGPIKKITNLLAGLITVIAIINPLLRLAGDPDQLNRIYSDNSKAFLELEKNQKKVNEPYGDDISSLLFVYINKINNEIKNSIENLQGINSADVKISVDDRYGSEQFGRVEKVELVLTFMEEIKTEEAKKDLNLKIINKVKEITGADSSQIIIKIE